MYVHGYTSTMGKGFHWQMENNRQSYNRMQQYAKYSSLSYVAICSNAEIYGNHGLQNRARCHRDSDCRSISCIFWVWLGYSVTIMAWCTPTVTVPGPHLADALAQCLATGGGCFKFPWLGCSGWECNLPVKGLVGKSLRNHGAHWQAANPLANLTQLQKTKVKDPYANKFIVLMAGPGFKFRVNLKLQSLSSAGAGNRPSHAVLSDVPVSGRLCLPVTVTRRRPPTRSGGCRRLDSRRLCGNFKFEIFKLT